MNFTFSSPAAGVCLVKLWATGRYGFSLPKKVEITSKTGETYVYLYYNRRPGLKQELTNRAIVRLAVGQFLFGAHQQAGVPVQIDDAAPPFTGALTQIRSVSARTASLRVRPGRLYSRTSVAEESAPAASGQG